MAPIARAFGQHQEAPERRFASAPPCVQDEPDDEDGAAIYEVPSGIDGRASGDETKHYELLESPHDAAPSSMEALRSVLVGYGVARAWEKCSIGNLSPGEGPASLSLVCALHAAMLGRWTCGGDVASSLVTHGSL